MLPQMFVNELSLVPADDVPSGQAWAEQYVLTIRSAVARGVKRTLRMPENFYALPLAPNYYWRSWLNDNRIDRELRQYFRSLATKAPFLRDEPAVESMWADIDCYWKAELTLGLKAAYVADGLALSIRSQNEYWNRSLISCEIQEIVDDEISCRSEDIHHASTVGHVDEQADWIQRRIRSVVASGEELWSHVNDFFPSLLFCSVVEKQMVRLPSNSLASILRGLFRLNDYCVSWQSGDFAAERIGCAVSPDSESTLQKYGEERMFLCPDGQRRIFTWHAKVGRWRIYFDPAPGPGSLFVGYVGRHLRTTGFQ